MKKLRLFSPLLLLIISNTTLATPSETEHPGKALYQAACKLCHAPDKAKAMKAPAAFDVKAWQQRFAMAAQEVKTSTEYKTVTDYLYHQITIGKGLMHHGGLCKESKQLDPNLKCGKVDYLDTIEYMSHKSN